MTVVIDEMEVVPAPDGRAGPEQTGTQATAASAQATHQMVERDLRTRAERTRRLEVY